MNKHGGSVAGAAAAVAAGRGSGEGGVCAEARRLCGDGGGERHQ